MITRTTRLCGAAWRVCCRLGLAIPGLLVMSGGSPPTQAQPPRAVPATYEVYALSYGVLPGYAVADFVAGADKSRRIDAQMMLWLIRMPGGKNILFDAGCYRDKMVKESGLKNFIGPSAALRKLGLLPQDISDIIVSHMHWDHVDGITLFPKAQIWIQKDEYQYYTGAAWQPQGQSGGIDADDVLALVRLNTEHRVNLVDGDGREIIDGITAYTGGRHTFASQYLGVRTAQGTVVLASDNMYLYENLEKHTPIAQTFDAAANLRAQDRMRQLASRLDLIVPGHDPQVFTRFPTPGNGVARIQ